MKGLARFAESQLGIRLHPGQRELLQAWEASGRRKAVFALGRRSGKGVMAAVAAIKNAVVDDYGGFLRPRETRFILVVATREQQAREFVRVTRELIEQAPDPDLVALVDVAASTADEVVFRTGVVLRAMPCSSRSIRGLPASLVVMDEAASFVNETDGFQAAKAVWRALAPSVAQFGDRGYALITSSPQWQAGWFFDTFRAGETGQDGELFVRRTPTWEMVDGVGIPGHITRDSLAGEFAADPVGASTEFGSEWLEGGGAFLDAAAIHSAVVPGRKFLPAHPAAEYRAAIDPAFSRGGDAFTLGIAHAEWDETGRVFFILDRLQAWSGKQGPLNSDQVLDEVVATLREFHIYHVISDQFAVVPIADALRRRSVELDYRPFTSESKANAYTSLKRGLNLGQVELLDDPTLTAELVRLELRPSPAGKPRIQGAGGFHDDRATVLAELVHALDQEEEEIPVPPVVAAGFRSYG